MRQTIYIDALPLVSARKSGIGYTLEQTLLELIALPEVSRHYRITLVVPLGKAQYLQAYTSDIVDVKTIYLPARILEIFLRLNLFPPMDWLLGTGVYIFPNYRNWLLWGSRSITYIYDLGFIRFPAMVQPKNQRYLQRYISRWTQRTDRLVAITLAMQFEIEKYLNIMYNKIDVVYCGVDIKLFQKRSARQIEKIRQQYGIPYKKYLLFVGNIEPRKNLQTLIDAYISLPLSTREQYGLVIVGGDGWLNESLLTSIKQARATGEQIYKVDMYVPTEDLPALYSGATALIHPAVYEGFGITPLEAMACQTPVIVADIPAIREVVANNGFYFDPHNPDALTKTLEGVLSTSGHQKILENGFERAIQMTWRQSAEQLLSVIEKEFAAYKLQPSPLLKHLKSLYLRLDRSFRALCGEKEYAAYRPDVVTSLPKLQKTIYDDFLREQPSGLQNDLLAIYQTMKHQVAKAVKVSLRTLRSRRS